MTYSFGSLPTQRCVRVVFEVYIEMESEGRMRSTCVTALQGERGSP